MARSPLLLAAAVLLPGAAAGQPSEKVRFAVIELDAARVKPVCLDVWEDGGKLMFKEVPTRDVLAWPGVLEPDNKKLIPGRVQEGARALARMYHAELCQKLKVPPGNIYLVASAQFDELLAEEKEKLRTTIADAVRQVAPPGWAGPKEVLLGFVTFQEQLEYTSRGLARRDGRVRDYALLDVGPGTLQAGYYFGHGPGDPDGYKVFDETDVRAFGWGGVLPGASRLAQGVEGQLRKDMKDPRAGFPDALPGAVAGAVTDPLNREKAAYAGFTNRDVQFLMGDMAEALVVLVKPEALLDGTRDRVAVTPADVEAFFKAATARDGGKGGFQFPPPPDLPRASSEDLALVQSHYDRIKATYTPEQLASGAAILRAATEALYDGRKKELYVLKDASHTWATAYLKNAVRQSLVSEKK